MNTAATEDSEIWDILRRLPKSEYQLPDNVEELVAKARLKATLDPKSMTLTNILLRFRIHENQIFK
jgi:hypothetical protein